MPGRAVLPALVPLALLPLLLQPAAASFAAPSGSEGPEAEEAAAAAAALGEDDECGRAADGERQACTLQALQLRRVPGRAERGPQEVQQVEELELEAGSGREPLDLPQSMALESEIKPEGGQTCKMTALKLKYGAQVGVFGLPGNASVGTLVRHSCEFEETKFPRGEVTFECRGDRWHYKSDTCALCAAASLPVEVLNASGSTQVPRATRAGERAEVPCKDLRGGQAAYEYGEVSFVCQENGTWAYEKQSCSVCPASSFNLSYGGDPGLFALPAALSNGQEAERPCEFTQQKFPVGSVRFACEAGRWKFAGDSCASCAETNLTVKSGDDEGTFELPRMTRTGGRFGRPCNFSNRSYGWGSVDFECTDKGWSFANQTCMACPASAPFNVTYGADVGVFQLPSAASQGEVKDMPCVFGAVSYGSGVVRFACDGSRWHLQTVTCISGES